MKIFFIALLTITLSFTVSAQELTPKDIFLKAQQELLKHDRVEYLATAKFKFFDPDDTIQVTGTSQIIRDGRDSLFGGKIYYMPKPTLGRLYDLKNIYQIDFQTKSVVTFDPQTFPGALKDHFAQSKIIWDDFLKPALFTKRIEYSPVRLNDTTIEGRECYQIRTELPDDPPYSNQRTWRYFTKDSFIPVLVKGQIRFQDNYQYNELQIHSWDFTQPTDIALNLKTPLSFKIQQYIEPDRNQPRTLAVGTSAPKIWGDDYHRNNKNDTIQFEGNVTVLDFWYMSCYPCIKAIPQMEQLFKKYSAKGLQVVGVNAYDNNEKSLKRIPEFLKNNPIEYKILMVENSFPPHLNVSVWPTFYIIDKTGKIKYAQAGIGENTFKEMDEIIGKLLE